jgi:hypothetical protein
MNQFGSYAGIQCRRCSNSEMRRVTLRTITAVSTFSFFRMRKSQVQRLLAGLSVTDVHGTCFTLTLAENMTYTIASCRRSEPIASAGAIHRAIGSHQRYGSRRTLIPAIEKVERHQDAPDLGAVQRIERHLAIAPETD